MNNPVPAPVIIKQLFYHNNYIKKILYIFLRLRKI